MLFFSLFHCCYSFFAAAAAAALVVKPWMQHVSVCSVMLLMSGCKTLSKPEAQKVRLYRPGAARCRCPLLGCVCILCLGHLQNGKCSASSCICDERLSIHGTSLLSHTKNLSWFITWRVSFDFDINSLTSCLLLFLSARCPSSQSVIFNRKTVPFF